MKVVRTILLLPICLLACALLSLPTLPTSTAIPPPTQTTPSLPNGTPTQLPPSPPSVTLSAADFTPILYRDNFSRYNEFRVIGGVQAGAWLPAEVVTNEVQYEQAYELYANGYAGVAITKDYGTPLSDPRCGDREIGSDFSTYVPNVIGVKQGWDVTFRPLREIAVDTPVYYAAVADWLTEQGFTLPYVQINRIVLTDLEGDGVDEVIIDAAYFQDESGHVAVQGDYSIVLMRKLVGGDVVAVPVVADLYTSPTTELAFPFTYSLTNLLDLNQDGKLEIIVEVTRWEGGGVMIYEVDGTNVTEVIREVCAQ